MTSTQSRRKSLWLDSVDHGLDHVLIVFLKCVELWATCSVQNSAILSDSDMFNAAAGGRAADLQVALELPSLAQEL